MSTQKQDILRYLQKPHRTLTPLEALGRFQCLRLAARCAELRSEGHNVVTDMVTLDGGKRVARYRLA